MSLYYDSSSLATIPRSDVYDSYLCNHNSTETCTRLTSIRRMKHSRCHLGMRVLKHLNRSRCCSRQMEDILSKFAMRGLRSYDVGARRHVAGVSSKVLVWWPHFHVPTFRYDSALLPTGDPIKLVVKREFSEWSTSATASTAFILSHSKGPWWFYAMPYLGIRSYFLLGRLATYSPCSLSPRGNFSRLTWSSCR